VPDYRLYFVDDRGHIERALELETATDEDAIAAVQQYRNGKDLELWQRARVVAKIAKLS
jgi:hypothetical protein